ncbi:unnamed protein product, partial [Phaeothamnion confervicola]
MQRDFSTPPYFSNFCNPQRLRNKDAWHVLSLAGSRAGLPWHVHGETWLGLVYGRKRWAIYPPGVSAPAAAE